MSVQGERGRPIVEAAETRTRHLGRKLLLGLLGVVTIAILAASLVIDVRKGAEMEAALEQLTWAWVAALLAGSVVVMLLTTGTTSAPLPQLSFRAAFLSQHASQAVGNLVPGPAAMATRFAMLRTYGVGADEFTRATVTVALVTTVLTASMPMVGMVMLALIGKQDSQTGALLPAAITATVLALLVAAAVVVPLASERATRACARSINSVRASARRLLRRPAQPDPGIEGALALRERMLTGLRESGRRVVVMVLLLYWANGVLLVLCLWAVGIPRAELGMIAGLAVYTIGRLSTLVQITPGGIGVVEVAYTAAYSAYLGPDQQGRILTAVLLYRIGTYALPILVGLVSAGVWAVTARRRFRRSGATGATNQTTGEVHDG